MPPKRVLIVDDQESFCSHWKAFLVERYAGQIEVETYTDPVASLPHLDPSVSLLMLDFEMPVLDGAKVLAFAVAKGVNRRRIVVTSARDADHLHEIFPSGECLAVINKEEPGQQEAFLLILDSVMRKP